MVVNAVIQRQGMQVQVSSSCRYNYSSSVKTAFQKMAVAEVPCEHAMKLYKYQLYFTNVLFSPDVVTIALILISLSGWLLGRSYGYISSAILAAFTWIVFEGFWYPWNWCAPLIIRSLQTLRMCQKPVMQYSVLTRKHPYSVPAWYRNRHGCSAPGNMNCHIPAWWCGEFTSDA